MPPVTDIHPHWTCVSRRIFRFAMEYKLSVHALLAAASYQSKWKPNRGDIINL